MTNYNIDKKYLDFRLTELEKEITDVAKLNIENLNCKIKQLEERVEYMELKDKLEIGKKDNYIVRILEKMDRKIVELESKVQKLERTEFHQPDDI